MKITHCTPTALLGFAVLMANGWAQDAAPGAANPPAAEAGSAARGAGTLRFNFRNAPLETVLN